MNLDSLTHTSGEWLRGSGPESDIVISSRVRLARNLAAFPFTNRASSYQKAEIEALLRDRIAKLELDPKLGYLTARTEPGKTRPRTVYTLTDKPPAPGSYEYVTSGSFLVGDLLLPITILHHQKDPPERRAWIWMVDPLLGAQARPVWVEMMS